MSVRSAITGRKSIRKFEKRPVENEKIEIILDSAHLAPTGHNTQPGRFIVITDLEQKTTVASACNHQPFVAQAPLLIVLLGDLSCRVKDCSAHTEILDPAFTDQREKVIRDCAIVGDHMMLQAHDLGLGVCWVGDYEQLSMRQALSSPPSHYIIGIFAMGYPGENPAARPRKDLDALVSYGRFGQKK